MKKFSDLSPKKEPFSGQKFVGYAIKTYREGAFSGFSVSSKMVFHTEENENVSVFPLEWILEIRHAFEKLEIYNLIAHSEKGIIEKYTLSFAKYETERLLLN